MHENGITTELVLVSIYDVKKYNDKYSLGEPIKLSGCKTTFHADKIQYDLIAIGQTKIWLNVY